MTHEEITLKIKEQLERFKDNSGTYNIPLDFPWSEFTEKQVQRILSANEPQKAYEDVKLEILEEEWDEYVYENGEAEVEFYLSSDLIKDIHASDYGLDKFIDEYIYFTSDDQELREQEVNVDILVDVGDMNTDFTQNIFANGYYHNRGDFESPDRLPQYSSLIWLSQQQGVSKEDLLNVLKDKSLMPEEFNQLREEKRILEEKLAGMGKDIHDYYFKHQGAYLKYLKVKEDIDRIEIKVNNVKEAIEKNSVTYEEFKKKHPNSQKVQNLKESEFYKMKSDALSNNINELNNCYAKKAEIQVNLLSDKEMREVYFTDVQYFTVSKELSEVINATPELARKNALAESIINESANTTTSMNALTFLVKMPLEKAMELNRIIKSEKSINDSYYPEERKGQSSITISKDCFAGLYDPWGGAGSCFDIVLAKDVELPIKYIFNANVGDYNGYSINSIFGEMDYTNALLSINEVPVKTLENMLENAASRTSKHQDVERNIKDLNNEERI